MPQITLVTTPTYPIPGRPLRVRVEPTAQTTGTHVRIWCTAAPQGTKLRKELDDSRATRVSFWPLLPISTTSRHAGFDITLEKAGGYVLQLDELQVGTGFTGGYEDDPRGAPGETIRSTGATTLYVAQPLAMQLGCGPDVATLKLYVHDSTVVQTELAVHGETTPRVDLAASATPRARLAAESTSVRSAVAALAGRTTGVLVGSIGPSLDDLITKFNRHLTQSGRHYVNDEDNTISDSFLGATTAPARAAALSAFRTALARHMRNDSGGSGGTGEAGYHLAADWQNLPIDAAAPTDALTDGIAHADAWRAYEAHRVSSLHARADGTNSTTALPPLLELHRQFLIVLAQASVTPPPTAPAGSALLVSQLGFKEV